MTFVFREIFEEDQDHPKEIVSRLKHILFYNPLFEQEDYYFGFGHKVFIDVGCPVSDCYITNNKSLLGNQVCKSMSVDWMLLKPA